MPLAIYTGRFARFSLDKKTSQMCTNTDKDIEDEMHILFTSVLYGDLREIQFKKILEAIPDFANMLILDKLNILFNQLNVSQLLTYIENNE